MKSYGLRIVLFTVLLQASFVWSYGHWVREKEILDRLLRRDTYNPGIPPGENATDVVTAKINMYIRGISNLDEMKMEYSMQVTFRQQWKDERLSYVQHAGLKYLTLHDASRIWTPDPFFSNENSGHFHNIVKPNVLLRIFPDGMILYSVRLSLTLKCLMDFRYYPMDRQACSIIIASYGYTTDDLVLLWKEGDPVQISKNLGIPHFSLEQFFTDYCTSRTNTGEYSCLRVDLLFRREFAQYFVEIYLPTIVLVALSWLCFALDHKDTTARVVLFASIFMMFSVKLICLSSKIPIVDCQSAYSIWITTCFGFLAAVMVKVGYDACLIRRQQRKGACGPAHDENDVGKNKSTEEELRPNMNLVFRGYHRLLSKYPSPQQRADVICLVLFPVAFTLFNIFYWSFNVRH